MQSLSAIFAAITANNFSLVVNEVYGTETVTLKSVRCPENIDLGRAINQNLQNDGVLRFTKADLASVMSESGFCLVGRLKGAGMEHIYKFSGVAQETPGLPVEAMYSLDKSYIADKRSNERLHDAANRWFAGE